MSLGFAAAMLAGCSSGSQSQLPLGSSATVQSPMMGADSCTFKGGVRVSPCKVILTASQPGPDTVTLTTPHGSKGSVVEHDDCGGGAEAGDCHAKFNYFNNGRRVGWAELKIENMI
jgi:hypothetical protein